MSRYTLAALALLALLAPSPASATVTTLVRDSRPCVSDREARTVDRGMRQATVHALFDTSGRRWRQGDGVQVRKYRACAASVYDHRFVGYKRVDGTWRARWVV